MFVSPLQVRPFGLTENKSGLSTSPEKATKSTKWTFSFAFAKDGCLRRHALIRSSWVRVSALYCQSPPHQMDPKIYSHPGVTFDRVRSMEVKAGSRGAPNVTSTAAGTKHHTTNTTPPRYDCDYWMTHFHRSKIRLSLDRRRSEATVMLYVRTRHARLEAMARVSWLETESRSATQPEKPRATVGESEDDDLRRGDGGAGQWPLLLGLLAF